MTQDKPTWAVVATVDEPPALVLAFVAWHLSRGASQIFIYCDKPDDPVREMLAHLPQVTVVICDDAHWLRVGKSRPRRHQVRQVRNARDAYVRSHADWLLHCDADEFLWAGVSVAQTLAGVSDAADGLIVPVAERIHQAGAAEDTIFAGAFRRPFREPARRGRRLFGPDFDLTYRGLTGHAQGKTFVRKGRALKLSIHRPRPVQSDQEVVLERAGEDALELLHFEGLTPAFWTFKLGRMVHALAKRDGMPPSDHRRKQADALLADPDRAHDVYDRLKRPDAELARILRQLNLLIEPAFDPTRHIAEYFPDADVDLRPEAIDAWLRQNKAHVLKFLRDVRTEKQKGRPEDDP